MATSSHQVFRGNLLSSRKVGRNDVKSNFETSFSKRRETHGSNQRVATSTWRALNSVKTQTPTFQPREHEGRLAAFSRR